MGTYRVDSELSGAVEGCQIFSADFAATSVDFLTTFCVVEIVAAGFRVALLCLFVGLHRHGFHCYSLADCQRSENEKIRPTAAAAAATNQLSW